MDIDFFRKTRIFDGGMGQELLARGMEPNGTLWSANALLQEKYHQLLLDTHLDFINAGAEIIVTATFTTRRLRRFKFFCFCYQLCQPRLSGRHCLAVISE